MADNPTTPGANSLTGSQTTAFSIKDEEVFVDDELHAMRAGVYELLAALLAREPEATLIDRLRAIEPVDASRDRLAMGWHLLRTAAEDHPLESIRDEYLDLFIGVGRGELVPFGSWYQTGFLMEKPLALLRAELAELGIERQSGVKESEDHVAALCDAMALVIRRRDEWGLDRQQGFFERHMAAWIERFADDLQAARAARFYRSVGFFAAAFFAFEAQLLRMRA